VTTGERVRRGRTSARLALYATSALVLAALVAACSSDSRRGVSGAQRADHTAAAGAAGARPSGRTAVALPSAAEASLRLQALLGQHTVLAADMMRGRLRGDPDLAQAANAALGKNTDAVGQLIGALFGDQAKTKFTSLWSAHVAALFNYARALADHDATLRAQAQSSIATYESGLAAFFAGASQGRLKRDAAQAAVKQHVDHLLHQADAYAAKDYAQADRIYREGYTHAFAIGKVLASTLLPPTAAATLSSPTWRLRSELDRLLGEHVVLVVATMRAGVTNSADFPAAADTVDANTRDLAAAIETLFGQAAGRRFQSLWADHVDALIRYSGGVAKHDDGQRTDAKARLARFEAQFAAFLAAATGRRMTAGAAANAVRMHDDMLLREAEAFVAKEYRQAHDIAYSTYQEMFTLAGQLTDAFGATVAARLPMGAVQTGRGGMAAVVGQSRDGG
jgi:hypothetical protein